MLDINEKFILDKNLILNSSKNYLHHIFFDIFSYIIPMLSKVFQFIFTTAYCLSTKNVPSENDTFFNYHQKENFDLKNVPWSIKIKGIISTMLSCKSTTDNSISVTKQITSS